MRCRARCNVAGKAPDSNNVNAIKIAELEKRLIQQTYYLERSVEKAEREVARHFEAVNHLQARMDQQAKEYITREKVDDRLRPLEKFIDTLTGKLAAFSTMAAVVAASITYFMTRIFK